VAGLQSTCQSLASAPRRAGSGSTLVGVGSDEAPAFLAGPGYEDVFVARARLSARAPGAWYQPARARAEAALAA